MQTSFTVEAVAGFIGDVAEIGGKTRPGRNNSGTYLPYGRLLCTAVDDTGGTDDAVRLPDATAASNVEVGLHIRGSYPTGSSDTGIPDDGPVVVLQRGPAWMYTEQEVNPVDSVYLRYAPGSSSDNDQIGVARKDADTLDDWEASTEYALGDRVVNDTLKIYECTTAGTSDSSGGPTGTGTGIEDNTAVWAYVGKCLADNATAVLNSKARFLNSGSAAGKVKVEVNYP